MRWLEQQAPPDIFARNYSNETQYTLFVPNNSLNRDAVSTKTGKKVQPKLLRDHVPGNSDVIYRWEISDVDAARKHAGVLDGMTSRLFALGWGIDFAAATAGIEDATVPEEFEHFTPSDYGTETLRVPAIGFYTDLDHSHKRFLSRITTSGIDPYTRATRFSEQLYEKAGEIKTRRYLAFELNRLDANALFAARWDQAQTVSAWLRHAAAQSLQQEKIDQQRIDSFVLGHTAPACVGYRLSFVPLPSIGHEYTDGGIRRVLIIEPSKAAGNDSEILDLLRIKLAGWILTDELGQEQCALLPVSNRHKVFPFYTESKQIWESVTPVVLHGFNAARGRISLAKTDRLLSQAFESAGLPLDLIEEMAFKNAPYWAGCEGAMKVRRPKHLEKWPLLHVRVKFKKAIKGPVLAGIGRHYGLGVFARR